MLSRKVLSAGIIRPVTKVTYQQQCAFSNSAIRQEEKAENIEVGTDVPVVKTPYRSARYLLEIAERQERNKGGRGVRRSYPSSAGGYGSSEGTPNKRFSNTKRPRRNDDESSSGTAIPVSRFKSQPSIPYDTTKELQFADNIDWEVTSVFESRPLYSNIVAGRGTVAPLGTIAVNGAAYNTTLPGTALSPHILGVRIDGDFDPETKQSLIQDIALIQADESKDHRKKSDVPSPENQPILFNLTQNFQEIMNPRISINQFNNGNAKNTIGIRYEIGSDNIQGSAASDDKQAEKSWKRLERLGGDYTRASAPLSLLKTDKVSKEGLSVMESVNQLLGQNQSIGLEDKKKFLKAVEKGLGGI